MEQSLAPAGESNRRFSVQLLSESKTVFFLFERDESGATEGRCLCLCVSWPIASVRSKVTIYRSQHVGQFTACKCVALVAFALLRLPLLVVALLCGFGLCSALLCSAVLCFALRGFALLCSDLDSFGLASLGFALLCLALFCCVLA